MTTQQGLLLACSLLAIGGMLVRPFRSKEWMWTLGGAIVVVVTGLLPLGDALGAARRGLDVYAFLIGIMALAELARYQQLFGWLATHLLRAAKGSRGRLFVLVYAFGALVTALLSNDTTAVVLTPAVFAALARTDVKPLPYLYACAFVANAASFVLPISNPANLVVFGKALPRLMPWLGAFGLASLAAVGLTFVLLWFAYRDALAPAYTFEDGASPLTPVQIRSGLFIAGATLGLVAAAALGIDVGLSAFALAAVAVAVSAFDDLGASRFVVRHLAWQVVPLVAGLFVIVAALDRAGALDIARNAIVHAQLLAAPQSTLLVGAVVTLASNVFNNLPVALASGYALQTTHAAQHVANAALVAVDLGPNLSVTGSLATLLWLIALRRDGVEVTAWQFLRLGIAVVTPALVVALLVVR